MQLRGFEKAHDLDPGVSTTVAVVLDKYAVSYWDEFGGKWKVHASQ